MSYKFDRPVIYFFTKKSKNSGFFRKKVCTKLAGNKIPKKFLTLNFSQSLQLSCDTFCLAFSLLDRTIGALKIRKRLIRLLAITCLKIAIKFTEDDKRENLNRQLCEVKHRKFNYKTLSMPRNFNYKTFFRYNTWFETVIVPKKCFIIATSGFSRIFNYKTSSIARNFNYKTFSRTAHASNKFDSKLSLYRKNVLLLKFREIENVL